MLQMLHDENPEAMIDMASLVVVIIKSQEKRRVGGGWGISFKKKKTVPEVAPSGPDVF